MNEKNSSKARPWPSVYRKKRKSVFPCKNSHQNTSGNLIQITSEDHENESVNKNSFDNRDIQSTSYVSINDLSLETTNLNNANEGNNDQESSDFTLEGRRIVDISFFIKSLIAASQHNPVFGCGLNNMNVIDEKREGFVSTLIFYCNMCRDKIRVHTNAEPKDSNINTDAVLGIMNIGLGFSHLNQLSCALEIPPLPLRQYTKIHDKIGDLWEETALKVMAAAANEEKELAIAAGDVDENGIPKITVVADGSWSKRSYRNNYNSLCGVAAIIGYKTKKVLYLGVRNKFCIICKLAENKKKLPSEHKCYKNWSGSASSMEADIIAEGFSKSLELYGIIFNKLIADGDSNCYKRILDIHPYKNIIVQKIECKNHLLRNYSRKIRELSENKTAGPLVLRQHIKRNELRLRFAVSKAIAYRKSENIPFHEKIEFLKKDLNNSISHIFGEHKQCKVFGYFCKESYQPTGTILNDLKLTDLYEKLNSYKNYLVHHAPSLIYDLDNNIVESFNSIIAKFIGSKRIHYGHRRSYQTRCFAAVVSHNTRKPIYTIRRSLGKKIGKFGSTLEFKLRKTPIGKRKRNKLYNKNINEDESYGPFCQKPDLPEEDFIQEKVLFLKSIKKTDEEIDFLQQQTTKQSESDLWLLERRKRLTASNFAEVCKRRNSTSCRALVEKLVYAKPFFSASIEWGKNKEHEALEQLKSVLNKSIEPAGLFVDNENSFLAATPDGLIGDKGIIEVKCPYSAKDMTPEIAIKEKKITAFSKDGTINKSHKWFYQIQGQLHVTRRSYCILACWTPYGLKTETIFRDDDFWKKCMEGKLTQFYMECLLPEIIDPRKTRNMQIRDPVSILEAKKKTKS